MVRFPPNSNDKQAYDPRSTLQVTMEVFGKFWVDMTTVAVDINRQRRQILPGQKIIFTVH